jgi:hypothetical protein
MGLCNHLSIHEGNATLWIWLFCHSQHGRIMPALKCQLLLAMQVPLHVISLFMYPITCMAWAQKHLPEGIGHRLLSFVEDGAFEERTSSAILISGTFAERS